MAKIQAQYEAVFIFNTKLGEEGVKELIAKFTKLIEDNGTIDLYQEWGKKKLAYLIEDETEGFYVLFNFTCKPDFPAELDRIVKITSGVLRSLVVVK